MDFCKHNNALLNILHECLTCYFVGMVISGGTLKIYGHLVNPDVPYKTLLLSVNDTAAHVVKETLDKYSMDKDDPTAFCLVEVRHHFVLMCASLL